jgi:hypothetical protein
MTEPARATSKDDAFAELDQLQSDGLILLEGAASAEQVSLDGWNPATGEQENGNVGGVVVRFLSSGSRLSGSPSGGVAPDRLDDPDADPFARDFFQQVYDFITSEWQDRTDQPDEADGPTSIGERSFIMHPDHPATAPGTPHGREAHRNHVHMQIGVTGTES